MEQLRQIIRIFALYLLAQLPAMAVWQSAAIPEKPKLLAVVLTGGLFTVLVGENYRRKLSLDISWIGLRLPAAAEMIKQASAILACVAAGLAWFSAYFTGYRLILPASFAKIMAEDGAGLLRSLAEWQSSSPGFGLAALVFGLLFMAVAEEYLFRGVIYNYLLKSLSQTKAVFWSSVSFALFHMKFLNFPISLVGGLLYCWLYKRTGSLLAPVLAHSLYNLCLVMFGERLVFGI